MTGKKTTVEDVTVRGVLQDARLKACKLQACMPDTVYVDHLCTAYLAAIKDYVVQGEHHAC